MTTKPSSQRANTSDTTTTPPFAYNAFLSYCSVTDYSRARKIETFLEAFHKNASSKSVAIRQLQICRDGSDFTLPRSHDAGTGLKPGEAKAGVDPIWPIIQAELSKSQFLVVLCSPGSIGSSYVSKEVSWFITNRGTEWIIPVVTESADPKNKPEQCFPAELISSRLHESLIWYDLRGLDRSQRATSVKDSEDELVRLAADLLSWDSASHGPLAAIWQREQSKRRRRQSFVALVAAVLMLALGGYALVSARQREQALLELASTLRQNAQLQMDRQQALDQRDREVAERERVANERDQFLDERDKALAGEKVQAEKAIRAAKIAEERRKEAEQATRSEKVARNQADKSAKEANNSLRAVLLESGRQELANHSPFQAAAYLSEAYKMSPPNEDPGKTSSLRFLLGLSMRSVDSLRYSVSYREDVNSVKFSPNGNQIIIAGADNTPNTDNTARVLDAKTGNDIINPVVHAYDVNTAEFSLDGKRIVTASDDNYAKVLDLETGETISFKHPTDVKSAKFSPDAKQIATVDYYGRATIWDIETRIVVDSVKTKEILTSLKNEEVKAAEFSPDIKKIVIVDYDGGIIVWDFVTRAVVASLKHQGEVNSAKFSPDGKQIVTAGEDKTAKVLNLETGELITLQHQDAVTSAEFSHDGKRLVTISSDKKANIWDVKTGIIVTFVQHQNWVRSAKFSPDSKQIVTASEDRTAKVWDVETGRLLASIEHQQLVRSAEFSPDGNQIATASFDKTAKVWSFPRETRTSKEIDKIVRIKVPFRLENGALVPRQEVSYKQKLNARIQPPADASDNPDEIKER